MSYQSEKYYLRLKEKSCTNCNKNFLGRDKQVSCSKECTKEAKLKGMKLHYKVIKCSDCSIIISTKIKYGSKATDSITIRRCKSCQKIHRDNYYVNRNKQKLALKRLDPLIIEKNTSKGIILVNVEKESRIIQRMKTNNPMKDRSISSKVSDTIKSKIKSGDIIYNKGKDHHLWKGNRDNNHFIRSRLTDWIKYNLKNANFKYSICESTKNLEVQYDEPLRDIILRFTTKNLSEYSQNSCEFENICNQVEDYHRNNDIGQVLCKLCHSKRDSYRKI